jgi:hypothetical protein
MLTAEKGQVIAECHLNATSSVIMGVTMKCSLINDLALLMVSSVTTSVTLKPLISMGYNSSVTQYVYISMTYIYGMLRGLYVRYSVFDVK